MKISYENHKRILDSAEKIIDIKNKLHENSVEITELNFSGNILYPVFFQEIKENLSKCKNLHSLVISRIFSTLPRDLMIEALSVLFESLPHSVEYVDISENALSCKLPDEFLDFISKNMKLRSLKINDCGLGTEGVENLMSAFRKRKEDDCFSSIDLSRNRITKGVRTISTTLKKLPNLRRVRIAFNTVAREDMEFFLKNISAVKQLHLLDIRDNFVNEEGMAILGKMYSDSLNVLLAGDCLIEDSGLSAFLNNLDWKKKKGHLTLDISYNDIEQEGIEYLTRKLEGIENLSLYVFGNEYDDCSKLAGYIYKNNGVVHVEDVDDIYSHVTIDELTQKVKEFF